MDFLDLGVGAMTRDYEEIWALQRDVHAHVAAGERPGTVLLVEHDSVFTAGRRTNNSDRPQDGSRVIDVDRGGRITWHGPGQLVAYPILPLAEPIDVVKYVRALEAAIMAVCDDWGVRTGRVEGRSGVWVDGTRKVCAIGVRVARGTTMHGIALNCDADLSAYTRIVPCGISDATVTTLSAEAGRHITTTDVLASVREHLTAELSALTAPPRVVHQLATPTPAFRPEAPVHQTVA